jgi:2-polyprenyl-3-methyl-5-hydroxy-6-metoxy-1,4-benzoquinol methylase
MLKYESNPDIFGSQSWVVRLIESNQKVLEVGCASGYVSEKLVKKGCSVVGIEIDEDAAKIAGKYCKDVIIADVEQYLTLPFEKKYFDVLLFGDVLEHLKDPSKTICHLKNYLKQDGILICSVPNAAYWYMRLGLLMGKWDYVDEGILDRTHQRYFTLKTAKNMLEECGFQISEIKFNHRIPFFQSLRKYAIIRKVECFIGNVRPTFFSYQFIIKTVMIS